MRRISVVMPLYNCAPFVAQAMDSVLGQTHDNIELLISDDCSSDGSRDIARAAADRDPRIRLFEQDSNIGLVANYNFLFERSSGDLIAIQDSDDWSEPTRLALQATAFDDPSIAACMTAALMHYPGGAVVEVGVGQEFEFGGAGANYPGLPATLMFRREAIDRYHGWPDYFAGGTSMDRYFIMELLTEGKGKHLPDVLYHARVRANSSHRTLAPRKATTAALFLELRRQRAETGTDWLKGGDLESMMTFEQAQRDNHRLFANLYRESAVIQIDCGNLGLASRLLWKAIRLLPFAATSWRTMLYLIRKSLRFERVV